MTVEGWARARRADLEAREFDNSLRVGPHKALGQQGFSISTLPAYFSFVRTMWQHRAKGVIYEATHASGRVWVYVYHRPTLTALLARHANVLSRARWSMQPGAFVASCRRHRICPGGDLYDLIATAYGDTLNPGRTDVLPGVPRATLLATYLDAWGEPDPSWIYFKPEHRPAGYPPG